MANNISIDQLANAIANELEDYSREVEKKIVKVRNQVAKDAVAQLKVDSPKNTGDYAEGWTKKKTENGWVIHNTSYQLTHLLEKGYAKKGGGRVAAQVHIAPVEASSIEKLTQGIEKAVREG